MGVYGGPNKAKGGIVFSLDGANPASYAGDSVTSLGTDYGYFAGGYGDSSYSTVYRVDFTNDTATAAAKGPLSEATHHFAGGTGNTSYGYVAAGGYPYKSTVQRIDYGNDVATAAVKGPLTRVGGFVACTGNASYGYWGGGAWPGPNSLIDRVDYSNDTPTALLKGNLAVSKYQMSATGTTSYGYFAGGLTPNSSVMNRVDYSSDTSTALARGPLTDSRYSIASASNSDYGYWAGGSPSTKSTVDRLDFSSDTDATVTKGPLTAAIAYGGGTGNSSHGYIGGGPSGKTWVQRIDYSSDTSTAAQKGNLTIARFSLGAMSSRANALPTESISTRSTTQINGTPYGYASGGNYPMISSVDRVDYSNDTATASVKGPISRNKYYHGATGNLSYGYHGGGEYPDTSYMDRIDYSNDSATSSPKGNLSYSKYGQAVAGNLSYGYWMGGTPGAVSTISRVDYADDTSTALSKGNLDSVRRRAAATGNASYAYCGAGQGSPGSPISTVDRIDYSNDTATAVAKGPLSGEKAPLGSALGTTSYGYFLSGNPVDPFGTIIDRIDYSNDTATASPKGNLAVAKYAGACFSSPSYGYYGGGDSAPSPGTYSQIDRIDFSNDTATALAKGNLSVTREYTAGSSSQSYGLASTTVYPWYDTSGRGNNANITDSRFRATDGGYFSFDGTGDFLTVPSTNAFAFGTGDFSVEYWVKTASGITTANIINPDSETGSGYWAHQYDTTFDWNSEYGDGSSLGTPYGYFGGGTPGPAYTTTVDRVDYSNDTPTAAVKGPLDVARRDLGATGSNSYGYWGGGYSTPSPIRSSYVSRVDYSNDTATASARGQLSLGRVGFSAVGTNSYGYFASGEGQPGATVSSVDRVDYSNDSSTSSPKGPLSTIKTQFMTAGNSSYGYLAGGNDHPNKYSQIDRIDYSNDTATAAPKGPLSAIRYLGAGTGNASYGYFGEGRNPSAFVSSVDRLDYSSDTSTASPKGPLGADRIYTSATGDTSYGYWAGGSAISHPGPSSIDRLDYSSDTSTASPKGPLSVGRYGLAGASSRANGLPTTSASTELYTCALSPVNDGEWHNVVMTRVGGTQQAYYDGVGITTTGGTYTDGTDYSGVDGWFIGKGGGNAFNGDLANITIRKGKGLSSDEVLQNFNALKSRFGV